MMEAFVVIAAVLFCMDAFLLRSKEAEMSLIKLKPIEHTEVKTPDEIPAEITSARAGAEAAIKEFQAMIFDLTYEQAKDAYARLLVGRGFDRVHDNRRREK